MDYEMTLERYRPSQRDTWQWHLAALTDVEQIVKMAVEHFQQEVESVFTPDPMIYSRHVSIACVEQAYDQLRQQLIVARQDNSVIAYAWLKRGYYMPYAAEECAEAAFAHINLQLPLRTRITLMAQIIQQWELWCQCCGIPVLVSTTIREDQQGFINLHRAGGFSVRGSFAFKRIKNV